MPAGPAAEKPRKRQQRVPGNAPQAGFYTDFTEPYFLILHSFSMIEYGSRKVKKQKGELIMKKNLWTAGRKIGVIMIAGLLMASTAACGSTAGTTAAQKATGTTAAQKTASTAAAQKTTGTTAAQKTGTQAAETKAAGALKGTVTAAGSSALLPLAQAAAADFMKMNSGVSVTVNGGGSGTGLKQVSDGSVDIGNSDVFAEEKLDAAAASALKDHKVCIVTMVPVVNKNLEVKGLSTQQLTDIFTGKITNWKDAGGPDREIMLVTRPSSSGTRALFKKWALGGAEEAGKSALETDDSGTLLQTVEGNDGAIGYVALSYLVSNDKVKALSIDGTEPTLENTYNGKYKVWGYEHMYTKGDGNEAAQAFIGFMTGDAFSKKIEDLGYGVTAKLTDAAVSAHK